MRETEKLTCSHDQWIWTEHPEKPNSWVIFTRTFEVERLPSEAVSYGAADTKYWLYLNGRQVVFEGSLFRESVPGGGYYDAFDLAPFLREGTNRIDVLVWYHGNEGRNSVSSGHGGFFFCCDELGLYSDEGFLCCEDTAFYLPEPVKGPVLHGGYPIGYRSGGVWQSIQRSFSEDTSPRREIRDGKYQPGMEDAAICEPAREDGARFKTPRVYPAALWGDLYERPIPLHRTYPWLPVVLEVRGGSRLSGKPEEGNERPADRLPKEGKAQPEPGDLKDAALLLRGKLPHAMALTPRIRVKNQEPVTIRIHTDRYRVNGGPGDETNAYENHYYEFVSGGGAEEFQFPWYLYGEELLVSCDKEPEELAISVMESGFDADFTGTFVCENEMLNTLVQKAARTLYVCMRDNFFDCPDRERGQWIGDVSVQVPQVFYLLDENGRRLVRKAIYDFILLRRGDILQGNVPGVNSTELPAQSLCAVSEWGMIAKYYHFTQDKETMKVCFGPIAAYLKLWECGEQGLTLRKGDWQWYDHLYNQDGIVIEHAWYYSALRFLRKLGTLLEDHRYEDFIAERMKQIENVFEGFWNGYAYSSGQVIDDRANALAVLSGLCPREHYDKVAKILVSVCSATVFMENFVLTALCEMGYTKWAYERMMSRYYPLAVNENSTLWEDFFLLGTKNHAWSGAPATIAFRYLLGLDSPDGYRTFSVNPSCEILNRMDLKLRLNGKDLRILVEKGKITINGAPCEAGHSYALEEL